MATEDSMDVTIGQSNSTMSSQDLIVPGAGAIDITPNVDGGVLKEILREGVGDDGPFEGEQVFVHYLGQLPDGTKFDSSRDRGDKFDFVLGKGRVIKAWDLGVATMKRGEVARFFCRSDYAYGETGSPPRIPPNATLVFEVELFDWKMEDISKAKDEGILRRTLKKGEGYTSPNEGALVNIHIVGRHNDIQFDDRSVQFNIGEGSEQDIPDGIEVALEKFKKGEKSLVKLSPAYGFGSKPMEKFNLPPNADLEYEVELKSFEKAKESWEFDVEEKIEQAKIFKDKGTQYFKEGKYSLASKQYSKIVSFLEFEKTLKDEKLKEKDQLLLAAHLNVSMCALKMENHIEARDSATKALEIDSENEKGLFRRGMAHSALAEPELALRDFEKIVSKDPNNKAALNQIAICKAKIKELTQREKQLYSNIFRKMAEQDKLRNEEKPEMPVPDEWSNGELSNVTMINS
ncbi:peptidyl-prolyl cis-trans isomerase FKBP4-like isoform X2 [Artemia franciscana]|uniref:peptidylprolyl isomerase n=2 Tax=Artemia franciscana TaxID=6661 RepID=A0A0H3VBG5_ARTSF|nr:hypothetical protein QYM36_010076 [Artemia franciscana]